MPVRDQIRGAAGVGRAVAGASWAHRASPAAVARRAADLRRRGFTLREARLFGLLDPRLPSTELSRLTSRAEAYAVQDALNPESFRALAEDKALFARFCDWRGLPTPRVLAFLVRGGPGWVPGRPAPCGRGAWLDVIREELPDEFVVKPAWGHLGKGVRFIAREGRSFRPVGAAATMSAEDLLDELLTGPGWPAWILQERLRSHETLERLSTTDAVQTVRAITLLDPAGRARVLWAELRVVMGDHLVDNWRDGTTGNGLAPVDLGSGRLGPVVAPGPRGRGTCTHDRHPRSGARFADVVLPWWDEAVALLLRAAPELAPMRAIGWDVVIGPGGPLLLEVQARWGPHNQSRAMPAIMAALVAELTPRADSPAGASDVAQDP